MFRQHLNSQQQEVNLLSVPWFPQQDRSYYCFPYSLWMVLQFYRNVHENRIIRANTPNLDVDEIAGLCKTNPQAGTRVSAQLMLELSKKIPTLSFELKIDASIADINNAIRDELPCIVLYDCGYLLYKTPSKVGHAGVVINCDSSAIYLSNPWLGPEVEVSQMEFVDAWELNYRQIVLIKPNYQAPLHDNGSGDAAGQQTQ